MTAAAPLTPGCHAVPEGHLATTVTHLDWVGPPGGTAAAPAWPGGVALSRVAAPELGWYRALFRAIGEDWLWVSRLAMDDAALAAILADPAVEVWALSRGGVEGGLLELDFRTPGACEVAFFGLIGPWQGQGLARPLMAEAIARAAARGAQRLHLHTCTHDHPGALRFYRSMGFVPVRSEVEVMPDPRRSGLLRADAAPHVPCAPAPAATAMDPAAPAG